MFTNRNSIPYLSKNFLNFMAEYVPSKGTFILIYPITEHILHEYASYSAIIIDDAGIISDGEILIVLVLKYTLC